MVIHIEYFNRSTKYVSNIFLSMKIIMLNKLELKIWSEPSLFLVPWKITINGKLFEILQKEDHYIRIY